MKKTVKQLKGNIPILKVEKNGQHVGILNTENVINECVHYDTETRPVIGENMVLPEEIRLDLSYRIKEEKDIYYGILYPNEKSYKKELWDIPSISQELANFTTISKITHWGRNTYIHLTRDKVHPEIELLFSTAYNWTE